MNDLITLLNLFQVTDICKNYNTMLDLIFTNFNNDVCDLSPKTLNNCDTYHPVLILECSLLIVTFVIEYDNYVFDFTLANYEMISL